MTMIGRCSWMSVHVMERPATRRLPIVSKYPGAKLLKRRRGRAAGSGPLSRAMYLPLSFSVLVIDEEIPTDVRRASR